MGDIVKIRPADFAGVNTHPGESWRCPVCENINIDQGFKHCPDCGVAIEFEVERDSEGKVI